jgi:hypothetical protein
MRNIIKIIIYIRDSASIPRRAGWAFGVLRLDMNLSLLGRMET